MIVNFALFHVENGDGVDYRFLRLKKKCTAQHLLLHKLIRLKIDIGFINDANDTENILK